MLRFLWDCFICGKASVLYHPTPDQGYHLRPVFIYQLIEKSKKHHRKALNSLLVGITAGSVGWILPFNDWKKHIRNIVRSSPG